MSHRQKALVLLAGQAIVGGGVACNANNFRLLNETDAGQTAADGTAGQGGAPGSGGFSGQGGAGTCADPLRFADPDVEMSVRDALDIPAGPIPAAAAGPLSDLNLLLANIPGCGSGVVTDCIDYVAPPSADGWITSLVGVECLPHLQRLGVDPFSLDLSPLAALPELTTLWLGPALETNLVALPRITLLRVATDIAHLPAILRAFPSLTALELSVGPLPDTPEVRAALSGLTILTTLTLGPGGCAPTLTAFLNARGVVVTGC